MLARVCALAVMLLALAPAIAAEAPPLTIDALQGMVTGLGFETSTDHKTTVSIRNQAVANATVVFDLGAAGASLKISVPFAAIPNEKAKGVPALEMLKFNASHPFAFVVEKSSGKDRVVLERTIDASEVNPVTLRKTIDGLKTAVGESRKLWNQDDWPMERGAPKTYAALLADADAIWKTSPFELHNLMFVTERPSVFGAYKPRGSNVFRIGEPMLTYVEPFGYAWAPGDGGFFRFGVWLDYALLDGDKILSEQDKVLTYSNASRDKIREFMLSLSLNFNGLLPGKYSLRYKAHDMYSDKTATATIPFEINE